MPTRREFFIASSAAAASAAIVASPKLIQVARNRNILAAQTPDFKIIALEEHVALPPLQAAWSRIPELNIWITGSGTQSERYLCRPAEVVGVERMLYSTDYPYTFGTDDAFVETSKGRARSFLDNSSFTLEQKAAIRSGN